MFWYVSGYNLLKGMEKHDASMAKAAKRVFRAGTVLDVNLNTDQGYIVLSGEIRCDFATRSNQSLGLISLLGGECFGGSSSGTGAHVVLTAIRDTQLVELSVNEMTAVAKSCESVPLAFYKGILRRKVVVTMSPERLIFKSPKLRLEEALKLLAVQTGVHHKASLTIRIRPTSGRLAKMAGLGRLHTILALAELYNDHKLVPGIKSLDLPL